MAKRNDEGKPVDEETGEIMESRELVPTGPQAVEEEGQEPVSNFRRTETIREEQRDNDATISCMATINAHSNRKASNGNTLLAQIEVDVVIAPDFEEMIGERTFIFKADNREFGEATIETVTTKRDDNMARTVVNLKWSGDQVRKFAPLCVLVSKTVRLDLWEVQLTAFGAAKPE